jgi:hypothetical protein
MVSGRFRVFKRRFGRSPAADITDPDLIRKILDHLQQRAPPWLAPRQVERQGTNPDRSVER